MEFTTVTIGANRTRYVRTVRVVSYSNPVTVNLATFGSRMFRIVMTRILTVLRITITRGTVVRVCF